MNNMNNSLSGENEAVLAGVGKLHGVAELNSGAALGPVVTSPCHETFYCVVKSKGRF